MDPTLLHFQDQFLQTLCLGNEIGRMHQVSDGRVLRDIEQVEYIQEANYIVYPIPVYWDP